MRKLEERIARLEQKRGGSEPPPLIPAMIFDGETVTSCMVIPAGVAGGLSAFYERRKWRDRATCPDADTCPHAGHCVATPEA